MNKKRNNILKWIENDECRKKILRRYLNEMKRDYLFEKVKEMYDNYEKDWKREGEWELWKKKELKEN